MRPIRVAATVAMVDDEVDGDVVPGDDRVGVGEVVPFLEVIVSQLAEGIPGESLLPRIEVDIGDQRTDLAHMLVTAEVVESPTIEEYGGLVRVARDRHSVLDLDDSSS